MSNRRQRLRRQLFECLESRQLLAGTEFDNLVNTLVPRLQASQHQSTSVAVTSSGDTLVAYQGRGLVDSDGIYVRRIHNDGTSTGDRLVNQTISDSQQRPQIAVYPNGNYVIAWDGRGPGDTQGIFARWYRADDQPLTSEVRINSIVPGTQYQPDVAVAADGTTLFVWSGSGGADDPEGIYRRAFDASGAPLSAQFRVNQITVGRQEQPSIAVAPDGRSVVTWSSHDLVTQRWQTFYQLFNAGDDRILGAASPNHDLVQADQQVSAGTTVSQYRSRVGMDAEGRFVVAWSGFAANDSLWNIFKRSFAADGRPIEPHDLLVNSQTGGVQRHPDLAMAEDGRFIISWSSGVADGSGWEVFAKLYDAGGRVAEADYIVHESSGSNSGHQTYSAVAIGRGPGQVVWSGAGAVDRQGVWIRRSLQAASPVLLPIPDQSIAEQTEWTYQLTSLPAVPGQVIRYDLEPFSHPLGLRLDPFTGLLSWTPSEEDGPGEFSVVVQASDAERPELFTQQRIRITVHEVNRPPSLFPIQSQTIDEGDRLVLSLQGTDPDVPRNRLTYSLLNTPSSQVQLDPRSGSLSWQTDETDGPETYQFTVRVVDDGTPPLSADQVVTVTVREVNQSPVIEPIADQVIDEELPWSYVVVASDSDWPSHGPLSFSLDSRSLQLGMRIDDTGMIRWTPSESQGPSEIVAYVQVTDSLGATATEPVSIRVREVNRPPLLDAVPNQQLQPQQPWAYTLTSSDRDQPVNTIRFALDSVSRSLGMTIDAVTGQLSWIPTAVGSYPVTVTASDDGEPSLSDSRQFVLTVGSSLQPPQFSAIPNQIVDEQTSLSFTIQATSSTPGRDIRYTLADGAPAGLSVNATSGEVHWVPSEAQGPQVHCVTFVAFDAQRPDLRSTTRVDINVLEVNRPPVISGIADVTLNEGELFAYRVNASDPDLPANRLQYQLVNSESLPRGLQIHAQTGELYWQTDETSGPGSWLVRVRVSDDGVPQLSAETDFQLTVREVNQPLELQAIPDQIIDEQSDFVYQLVTVDKDIPRVPLHYALDQASLERGLQVTRDGVIQWTPSEQQGPGRYEVVVSVAKDELPQTTVTRSFYIDVREVNRRPSLQPVGSFSIRPGSEVRFVGTATDPDIPLNQFTYSTRGNVPPGAILDPASGAFQWTASTSLLPQRYTFWLRVADNGTPSLFDEQPVSIEVLPQTIDLVEEARFVTAYEQRIVLQDGTSALRFVFADLEFDTSDFDSMNDAFEASLVDDTGRPLAAIISPFRDAFYNQTESQLTLLGSGVTVSREGELTVVTVDVSHLQAGTGVRLVQRLVNNDQDDQSRVTLYPGVEQLQLGTRPRRTLVSPQSFAAILGPSVNQITDSDWRHMHDVTGAINITYDHTTYDLDSQRVAAGVTLTNTGQYPLRGPLLVPVTQISTAEVTLWQRAGVVTRESQLLGERVAASLQGASYLDLTSLLDDGALLPGQSLRFMLEFGNPTSNRFDYQLHVLSVLNHAPHFESLTDQVLRQGNELRHYAVATDPDDDPLRYEIIAGPSGLTIDSESGELKWRPSTDDLGRHRVLLRAVDPFGLSDETVFDIEVVANSLMNRPPRFISDPIVDAFVGQAYHYAAAALDPDFDPLLYSLIMAPNGMSIPREQEGPREQPVDLQWVPTAEFVGQTVPVKLLAEDGLGGVAEQSFLIRVHANSENQPPLIVSTPATEYRIPVREQVSSIGDVAPALVRELLAPGQTVVRPISVTLPDDVGVTSADVVFVVDESGSMEEQAWIAAVITQLEQAFTTKGLIDNRYAIVGYGSFQPEPRVVTEQRDFEIRLYGPSGTLIQQRVVRAGEPLPTMAFPHDGNYTLAVTRFNPDSNSPDAASVPPLEPLDYQFTASVTSPDEVVHSGWGQYQGQLGDSGHSITFTSSAGQWLLIDGLVGEDVSLTLIDPLGESVIEHRPLLADNSPILLHQAGDYRIQLGGVTASPFQFSLLDPVRDAVITTRDQNVNGTLVNPNAMALYRFEIETSHYLLFDRLTAISSQHDDYDWFVMGPDGVLDTERLDEQTVFGVLPDDAYDLSLGPITATGSYTVVIHRSGRLSQSSAVIPYHFRGIELSRSGAPLVLDTPTPFSLTGPTASHHYSVDLQRGDQVTLDFSLQGHAGLRWRFVDPFGLTIAEGSVGNGNALDELPIYTSGEYGLVFQGFATNQQIPQGDYQIRISQAPLPDRGGESFELNELVQGNLIAGEAQYFTIDIGAGESFIPTRILPSGESVQWELRSPSGAVVFSTKSQDAFGPNPGLGAGQGSQLSPITAWEGGRYRLEVVSPLFDVPYAFYIAGHAQPLAWAEQVSGRLTPSGSLVTYSLAARAGQQMELYSLAEDALFAAAPQAAQRAQFIRAQGDHEDGYWGIHGALDKLHFRPTASRQVILLTDEDRDPLRAEYTLENTRQRMEAADIQFHVMSHIRHEGSNEGVQHLAMGADLEADRLAARLFFPKPVGDFREAVTDQWRVYGGVGTTERDYVALAQAVAGTSWDIDFLRGAGDARQTPAENRQSFSQAFVTTLMDSIEQEAVVDLRVVPSDAPVQIGQPQTVGRTLTFPVAFQGDGDAWNMEFEFFDRTQEDRLYGMVPGLLAAPYWYTVEAIDPEQDPLQYSMVEPLQAHAQFDSESRLFTFAPQVPGQYTFTANVHDINGGSDSQTWTVNVVDVGTDNSPPIVESPGDIIREAQRPLTLSLNASDSDGDLLTYRFIPDPLTGRLAPAGLRLDPYKGELTWIPQRTQIGEHPIAIQVSDGRGGRVELAFRIEVTPPVPHQNHSPQFLSSPITVAVTNERYRYDVVVEDADRDALQFDLVMGPAGMVLDTDSGQLTWQPRQIDIDRHLVILRVDDGQGGTTLQRFFVDVVPANVPPQIVSKPTSKIFIGEQWIYEVQVDDRNGDIARYYLGYQTTANGAIIDRQTGRIVWIPTSAGDYHFEIVVEDRRGGTDVQEFQVHVGIPSDLGPIDGDNVGPQQGALPADRVKTRPPQFVTYPRGPLFVGTPWKYHAQAVDPDGGAIEYALGVDAPSGMTIDVESGQVTWFPTEVRSMMPLSILARDQSGTVSIQSFALSVEQAATNHAPHFISLPSGTPHLGQLWQYRVVASDRDGESVSFTINDQATEAGMEIDAASGELSWNPETLEPVNVTITASDSRGGSATQAFTLRPEHQPRKAPRILSIPVGPAVVDSIWTYRLDAFADDGSALQYSVESDAPAGWLHIDARTGMATYRPLDARTITGKWIVSSEQGLSSEQPFVLQSKIALPLPGNTPPEITSRPVGPAYLENEWVYLVRALEREQDSYTFAIDDLSRARGMLIDPQSGRLSWTPSVVGSFPIEIRVTDARGAVATQEFQLLVASSNRAPQVTSVPSGPIVVGQGWTYAVRASDPEGDRLTYALNGAALHQGMSIDAEGVLQWTASRPGPVEVEVMVSDPQGALGVQRFIAVPQALTPSSEATPRFLGQPPRLATQGESFEYSVLAWDPRALTVDGGAFVYRLLRGPEGMQIDASSGRLSWLPWKPSVADAEPIVVAVEATNPSGLRIVQEFELTVVPSRVVNRPPVVLGEPRGPAARDLPYAYPLEIDDEAISSLQFEIDPISKQSGITIDQQGIVRWLPRQAGVYPVTVLVTDDCEAQTTHFFQLMVLPNAPPTIERVAPLRAAIGQPITIGFKVDDPNTEDTHRYEILAGLPEMTIDARTGVFTWVPAQAGEFSATVAAFDSAGGEGNWGQQFSIFDPSINRPPVIMGQPRSKLAIDVPYLWQVPVVDEDRDPLKFELVTAPVGASLDQNGYLRWRPAATQGTGETPHTIVVRVEDDRGGSDEATWEIYVGHTADNESPVISGKDAYQLLAVRRFQTQLAAIDPDGDTLFWSLQSGPEGMRIDDLGRIDWQPTVSQIGRHLVEIKVQDPLGASSLFTTEMIVRGENSPALIDGQPLGLHRVSTPYRVHFTGTDRDGDAIRFGFVPGTSNHQANLDPITGQMEWIPQETGRYEFRVAATDSFGAGSVLGFVVVVDAFEPNEPPRFEDVTPGIAEGGLPYRRQFVAIDPEGERVSYRVAEGPEGLSISADGLVQWQPDVSMIGRQTRVTLLASDPAGKETRYHFVLPVREPNQPPQFTSVPPAEMIAGQTLRYDLRASDANHDVLRFALIRGPEGVVFDSDNARVVWPTTIAHIGIHEFVVSVTDERIVEPVVQSWTTRVTADTVGPEISLHPDRETAELDQPVTIFVSASDNVGVVSRTLVIDGQSTVLDAAGYGVWRGSRAGRYSVRATATDGAGNTSAAETEIRLTNPNDRAPQIQLASPNALQRITTRTPVLATIQDDAEQLVLIRVFIRPLGGEGERLLSERKASAGEFIANIDQEVIAEIDSTAFANGAYRLIVVASDIGENVTRVERDFTIEGALKLGSYSVGSIDMSIPLPGMPLAINRVFNSLQADQWGDFGYGWKLDFATPQIAVDRSTLGGVGNGRFAGFVDGTRVQVAFADGSSEGFTFAAVPGRQVGGTVLDFLPSFVPDRGNRYRLEGPLHSLIRMGSEYVTEDGITYNPADPEIGNYFRVRDGAGVMQTITASSSTLLEIVDRNGNQFTFQRDEITSNRGKAIRIERDHRDRIAAITDPRGNKIQYQYDQQDRLVAVVDRVQGLLPEDEQKATHYQYDDQHPFLLRLATDPEGIVLFKNELDASGRMVETQNAFGQGVANQYDTVIREQVMVAAGNTNAVMQFDEEGRPIRIVDYMQAKLEFTYSAAGRPNSVTRSIVDAQGEITEQFSIRLEQDQEGRLIARTGIDGNTSYFTYDRFTGLPSAEIDPQGNRTTFQYDAQGNLTSVIDAQQQMVQYDRDAMGNITAAYAIDLTDGSSDGCQSTTSFQALCPATRVLYTAEYDAEGRQVAKTESSGEVTRFVYDANNQVVRRETRRSVGGEDEPRPQVVVSSLVLDANDRVTVSRSFEEAASGTIASMAQVERQFDAGGRTLVERDATGERSHVEYDIAGRPVVTRLHGLAGDVAVTYYIYDDQGRIAVQTNPVAEGQLPVTGKRYHYDPTGQLVRTDALVGLAIAVETEQGKPRVHLVETGRVIPGATAQPDPINHPARIAMEDGRSVERVRDHAGRTIESRTTVRGQAGRPIVQVQRTVFDSYGRVLTATDPFDPHSQAPITGITNVYASNGELLRTDQLADVKIEIFTQADGTFSSRVAQLGQLLEHDRLQYDMAGRLVQRQEPNGDRTEYRLDGKGRTVETRSVPADASQPTWLSRTYFDPGGQYVLQLERVTEAESDGPVRGTRVYSDKAGRTWKTEFVRDVQIRLVPELAGRYRAELLDEGIVEAFTENIYDTAGRIVQQRNEHGGERQYEYDALGNVVRATMEAYWDVDLQAEVRPRSEQQYVGGRRIATTLGIRVLADGSEDRSLAVTTEYIYDDQGRATATRLPNGQATHIEYNLAGQMIAETNDAGHRIMYEYNETGAMTAIVLPLVTNGIGEAYHPRTEFQYDDWGNRIVTRTGIAQRLDGSLDLTTLRESRDSYTDAGKLVSIARGDELIETRGYNALGQIEYRRHSNGTVQAYRWSTDPLQPGLDGTEFFRSWQDYQMQEPAIDVHESRKDWLGNTTQQYAAGTTHREYDGAGRLLAVRNAAGTMRYEYSSAGQLKAAYTVVEAGEPEVLWNRVEYEYDRGGRLSRVAVVARNGELLAAPLVYQYAYDVFGKVRQLVHPDGTIELHEYDALQRNTSVSYLAADQTTSWLDNQPIAVFQYSLDEVGHKAEIIERFYDAVSGTLTDTRIIRNAHDAVGRLVSVEQQDGDERKVTYYDYDAAHNRIAQRIDVDQNGTIDWRIEYQYDTVDRLLSEQYFVGDFLSQATSYDYTAGSDRPERKVKREAVTDRVLSETRFEYDVQGYLTLVEDTSYGDETIIRRVERSYAPSGNLLTERELQQIDGVTVYDEALRMLVDELSPTGHAQLFESRSDTDTTLNAAFVSGHRVLAESTGGRTRSLLADGMRSTRLMRDLQHGDLTRSDFGPFGELLRRETPAVGAYHGFSGELQDRSNDLVYLRKRTYAPGLGRFLQADTFAGLATEPTSLNRYIYASNAPYTFRDPSGNLFVLFDGTWNHDVEAELEEGEAFTNVVGLRDAYEANELSSRYLYQRGVGNTVDNGPIQSFLGGAFGFELTEIKNKAIVDTMFHLDPQAEEIYVTGFSRGSIAALQYAHDIERLIPEAKIRFMGIYDPVASVGFPGNGVNVGFNVSLASNVRRAYTLVSYQEDRGFFPGTNLHARRAYQEVTWGVHSDVGGGYATDPLAIIQDALYKMRRQFQSQGMRMEEVGISCPLCNGQTTHHPHPLKTYLQHGGQTFGEIGRPMVEYPMSGELGLAFFFDEMNFSRVGMTAAEARAAQTIWIPMRISQIYNLAEEFVQIPFVGRAVTATYMAWNLGALHQSHIFYALNRI